MAIETEADRAIYLDTADFGVTVTKADATTFSGIWDLRFTLIQPNGLTIGLESAEPRLMARTSDVSTLAHGDALTIQSIGYVVRGIEPDNLGMTTLVMERS